MINKIVFKIKKRPFQWIKSALIGVKEPLEGVARGRVDGDAVLARGERRHVNSVVVAVDLSRDHDCPCGNRSDLHVIVGHFARSVNDYFLINGVIIHIWLIGRNREIEMPSTCFLFLKKDLLFSSSDSCTSQ